MVADPKVDLQETSRPSKLIKQVVDSWHWVIVLDCNDIQFAIVDIEAQESNLLLGKRDRCTLR